jgi:hypothetical protein
MTREVLIGFDSAWTDSSENPRAVAAYRCDKCEGTCRSAPLPHAT